MIGVALAAPARAQARVIKSNETFPVEFDTFSACIGELIHVTGTVHVLSVTTINENGGAHSTFRLTRKVSGVGLLTGDLYQNMSQTSIYEAAGSDGLPLTVTVIETFRFVGQGPGNDLTVQVTSHLTVNENGEVTVEFTKSKAECTNA
jgi:hypothetical protein